MKKLILLFTLLLCVKSFSQEITTEKNRFFVEGKKISNSEVKTLLAPNTEALALFKTSRTKSSVGGFLLGFGGGLIIADLLTGATADVTYPTALTYVGVASLVISIPVLCGRNKKMKESLDLYNKGLKKNTANTSDFELNIISNQNGYGLQYRF
ncbi:MAG: hypothetical protein V4572_05325 [Bacteroidota bacterium]